MSGSATTQGHVLLDASGSRSRRIVKLLIYVYIMQDSRTVLIDVSEDAVSMVKAVEMMTKNLNKKTGSSITSSG